MFDCLLLHDSYGAFFVVIASSQHPAASPMHMTEITSSRVEPDEQPMYPLPGAVAAAADVAGTSATAAAPSAPPATAASQEDLTASASTPSSLQNHASFPADVVFLTIGSTISVPDGSSPRGCVQLVIVGHRLKIICSLFCL